VTLPSLGIPRLVVVWPEAVPDFSSHFFETHASGVTSLLQDAYLWRSAPVPDALSRGRFGYVAKYRWVSAET
jgi:hypothetical protein